MDTLPNNVEAHDAAIVDQFTRQAEPFVQRHGDQGDPLLALMAECAEAGPDDAVLDVACGPGIISCYFARRVRRVTGIDLVPAMIDRARRYQAEHGITNVDWQVGSCTSLPFADATFDCVVTRFSFHHFLDPLAALREMRRVCRPGGTVLVCDVAPTAETQTAFNHWEVLRDPSHTRALAEKELLSLGEQAGLELLRVDHYTLEKELEEILSGSFPNAGDEERIRALFDAETRAGSNTLGVAARMENGAIRIFYPVAVIAWRKPD